ncbi:unnamed protein product [Camellia sinensis]
MESKFASSSSIVFIILVFFFLCLTRTTISLQTNIIFNATVAQDGSGNYRRINDAIVAAPMHISVTNRYYIRVKPGVYSEYVVVGEDKTNIALIGDDAATTKITGNRSNATGFGTTQSATMIVDGEGFIGQSLTIENSAPINSGQAVALNNNANHSAFYKCIFMGYQDTLLANKNSQFYKNCEISGTVDFIFGSASAVFQDCGIYVRRLSPPNVITANGGKHDPTSSNFGFSFQNCTINVAPELRSRKKEVKAFLGRPWKNYATVVFMESYLDEIVLPEGWTWCCNNTIMMFAEYNNRGPGADTSRRAKLSGYNVFKSATEATPFTVSKLIDGDSWIPQTGIPYRGGLNSIPNWFEGESSGSTKANPFPLPDVYMSSQQRNHNNLGEIKQILKETQLEDSRKRELTIALHVYFKEWSYVVSRRNGNEERELAFRRALFQWELEELRRLRVMLLNAPALWDGNE